MYPALFVLPTMMALYIYASVIFVWFPLQVNVLSEQVEIQTEKIQELEYALSDSDRKLFDTESRLQEVRTCDIMRPVSCKDICLT